MKNSPLTDRSQIPCMKLPSAERLCTYLSWTGWTEIKQNDHTVRVFGTEQFDPVSQVNGRRPFAIIPANDSYSNAKSLILDAIELIAVFRKTDASKIIDETRRFEFDTIRQRIDIPGIQGISLKIMPELIKHWRDLIVWSVQLETIQEEKPLIMGKSFKIRPNANEVAHKFLFGHTFAGSFGITIDAPVSIDTGLFSHVSLKKPTLERNVVNRIASGLNDVAVSTQRGDVENIVSNYQSGFNHKLCELMEQSMKLFTEIDVKKIAYSFDWSPLILRDENQISATVELEPKKAIDVLSSAKKEMLCLHKGDAVTVKGEVIALADDPECDKSHETKRLTIILRCRNRNNVGGNVGQVRMTLSETDYKIAVMAHANRKWLSVKGILEPEGTTIHRLRIPQTVREIEPKNSLLHGQED